MADTVADIPALMDKMWNEELLATTDSGALYKKKGQPNSGAWGRAKVYRDRVKAAAGRPAPAPAPTPTPVTPAPGGSSPVSPGGSLYPSNTAPA